MVEGVLSWHDSRALGTGGHVARRALYELILSAHVSHVSACIAYRGMKVGETEIDCIDHLQKELDGFQRVDLDTVCAFMMKLVVGTALGYIPTPNGYPGHEVGV